MKIKIAEPNEWKYLSHHVWEEHHEKPVLKGFVVRFISGNKKNCAIENLELISQRENRARNSIHNLYTPEIRQAIHTLAGLKHRINKKKKEKENAQEQN